MKPQYRIAWKSRLTGKTGNGSWLDWSKEEVQKEVDRANKDYPDLDHWVETKP